MSRIVWFKEFGLFYLPVSVAGWLLSLLSFAFCIHIFVFMDSRAHSGTDLLYGIFPYVVPTLLGLYVCAMRTSAPRS